MLRAGKSVNMPRSAKASLVFFVTLLVLELGFMGYVKLDLALRRAELKRHCGQFVGHTYAYCKGSPPPPLNAVFMDLR